MSLIDQVDSRVPNVLRTSLFLRITQGNDSRKNYCDSKRRVEEIKQL